MLDTMPIETAPKTQQVLSFHILGYKTERDGKKLCHPGADDVFVHQGQGSISATIDQILTANGLTGADVISISADSGYGKTSVRDVGSWDFWLFCRNPKAAKTNG